MNSIDIIRHGSELSGRAGARTPRRRSRGILRRLSLLLFVIAPIIASVTYFGFVASHRYVSEVRFIVRSQTTPSMTGLSMFLRTFGFSRLDDYSATVQAYIESRDALHDLMEVLPMREILNHPRADILTRCVKPWTEATS